MDYIILGSANGESKLMDYRIDAMDNIRRVQEGGARLVFLGDYIDYGVSSYYALMLVFRLSYLENVVALRGDHEDALISFIDGENDDWFHRDTGLKASLSFLTKEQAEDVQKEVTQGEMEKAADMIRAFIKNNYPMEVSWLRKLPYYYETKHQIFVHAGIDEEAGEQWKEKTPTDWYTSKPFAAHGKFYKDIISGHYSTTEIMGDPDYRGILWDGQSHYYVDNDKKDNDYAYTLVYDSLAQEYRSFFGYYKTHQLCGRSWDE